MVYKTPGVYVEEVPSGARPIELVGTSTAAFLGVPPQDENVAVTAIAETEGRHRARARDLGYLCPAFAQRFVQRGIGWLIGLVPDQREHDQIGEVLGLTDLQTLQCLVNDLHGSLLLPAAAGCSLELRDVWEWSFLTLCFASFLRPPQRGFSRSNEIAVSPRISSREGPEEKGSRPQPFASV